MKLPVSVPIKHKDLKPGMVCEDWDHGGKVIESIQLVVRPMKVDHIRVWFQDGTGVQAALDLKMNIRTGWKEA